MHSCTKSQANAEFISKACKGNANSGDITVYIVNCDLVGQKWCEDFYKTCSSGKYRTPRTCGVGADGKCVTITEAGRLSEKDKEDNSKYDEFIKKF